MHGFDHGEVNVNEDDDDGEDDVEDDGDGGYDAGDDLVAGPGRRLACDKGKKLVWGAQAPVR